MAFLKTFVPFLPLMFLLFTFSEARDIIVGGKKDAWKVPSSADELNKWAEKNRFKVGDSLIWNYDNKIDSVLQVTKEDYDKCNTAKPIKEYKDGNTKVVLDKSGPFLFISGADGNCAKGEKLHVVVMSDGHWNKPADSPKPGPTSAPAPAPPSGLAPAPAPTDAGHELTGGFMGVLVGLVCLIVLVLV